MHTFCVKSEAGIKRKGKSGPEEIDISGLAIMISVISAIKVDNTSYCSIFVWKCQSSVSKLLPCGRKVRVENPGALLFSAQVLLNIVFFGYATSFCISLQAPVKLVPQSERSCFAGPCRAKKRHEALIRLETSMASISSLCTARMLIHMKSPAYLLLLAWPPRCVFW